MLKFRMWLKSFVRSSLRRSDRISWSSLETSLMQYENLKTREQSGLKAAFLSLKSRGTSTLYVGPSSAVFRSVEAEELVKNLVPATSDHALKEAYRTFYSALLDFRSPTAVSDISGILRDAASAAHQFKRQLYQTKMQAIFLSLLVPFFSAIFILLRWDNFLVNLGTLAGRCTLSVSFLFYVLGLFVLNRATTMSVGEFGRSDLCTLGGQESLLRRLRLVYQTARHGLKSVQFALLGQDVPQSRFFLARLTSFSQRLKVCAESSERSAADAFVESLWDGFVCQTHAQRQKWLKKSYDNALARIWLGQAKLVAQLNLRLILVMGIFFLPAFFLILALCGTVVSSADG